MVETGLKPDGKTRRGGWPVKPYPWEVIRLAFVARKDKPTCRQLSREFEPADSTIQKRAKREGWYRQREEHQREIAEKARQEIVKMETLDIAKSVRILEGEIARMVGGLSGLAPKSYERTMRELRETIKMLYMYQNRPAERLKLNEEEMEEVSKILLDIKKKAPEEYEKLKVIYEKGNDGGG